MMNIDFEDAIKIFNLDRTYTLNELNTAYAKKKAPLTNLHPEEQNAKIAILDQARLKLEQIYNKLNMFSNITFEKKLFRSDTDYRPEVDPESFLPENATDRDVNAIFEEKTHRSTHGLQKINFNEINDIARKNRECMDHEVPDFINDITDLTDPDQLKKFNEIFNHNAAEHHVNTDNWIQEDNTFSNSVKYPSLLYSEDGADFFLDTKDPENICDNYVDTLEYSTKRKADNFKDYDVKKAIEKKKKERATELDNLEDYY